MTRRSPRALRRRLALALSLMLVVSALALPALADDGPKTFTANFELDEPGTAGAFDVTLTLENTSPRRGGGNGRELGSANVHLGDNASFAGTDERLQDGVIELRDLGLRPGDDHDFPLVVTGECGVEVTFGVIAKQSNDFQGTGNDLEFQEGASELTVTLECGLPPYLAGLDVADCSSDCSVAPNARNGHELTASSDSSEGELYAGFRPTEGDPHDPIAELATDFSDTCEELVAGRANKGEPFRLAGEVAQVEPVGLSAGEVTVTMTIPRSEVNTDQNRSADVFTVCFLGDAEAFNKVEEELEGLYGGFDTQFKGKSQDVGNPELFGPVLLPTCAATGGVVPCIESRQKVRADVQMTVRIAASDPWMR